MNKALQHAKNNTIVEEFGIQSEKHILWLAAFEVPKEMHSNLKWAFEWSSIPDIMHAQLNGELLHV